MYQPPPGWNQPPQWVPPPKPSGAQPAHIAIGCGGLMVLSCVMSLLINEAKLRNRSTSTPPSVAPTSVSATPPAPLVSPAPTVPEGVDPPAGVNTSNRMVMGLYRGSRTLQEARTSIAGLAVVADRSIQRAAATGERFESATYVSPECGRRWLARLSVLQVPFAGAQGTVGDNLRDGGFENMQCVRAAEPDARVWMLPLRR